MYKYLQYLYCAICIACLALVIQMRTIRSLFIFIPYNTKHCRIVCIESLVQDIVTMIDELRATGVEIELRWVPVHIGIPSNKKADIKAKRRRA